MSDNLQWLALYLKYVENQDVLSTPTSWWDLLGQGNIWVFERPTDSLSVWLATQGEKVVDGIKCGLANLDGVGIAFYNGHEYLRDDSGLIVGFIIEDGVLIGVDEGNRVFSKLVETSPTEFCSLDQSVLTQGLISPITRVLTLLSKGSNRTIAIKMGMIDPHGEDTVPSASFEEQVALEVQKRESELKQQYEQELAAIKDSVKKALYEE